MGEHTAAKQADLVETLHLLFPTMESQLRAQFLPWLLFVCVCYSLSHAQLFATPWTVAHQAPLSMGFSKQEYWSGLPFPPPGDLANPGIEPKSPALQADSFLSEPPGKLSFYLLRPKWAGACARTSPARLLRLRRWKSLEQ